MSIGQSYTPNTDNLGHSFQQGGQPPLTYYSSCHNSMQSPRPDNFSSVIINSRVGPTSLRENMPSGYADWISPFIETSPLPVIETSLFESRCSSKMIEVEPVLKDVKLKAPEPDDEDKESLVEAQDDDSVSDQILISKNEASNSSVHVKVNDVASTVDSTTQSTVLSGKLPAVLPEEFNVNDKATFQPNVRTMLPVKVVGPNNDERNFVIESGTDQDYNCDNSVTSKFGILNTTSAKSSEEVGTAVCATEVIPSNEDAPVRSVSKGTSGNGAEAACRLSLALDSDADLQILRDNGGNLFERTSEDIPGETLLPLNKPLINNQDASTQHDLDLRFLAEVKHKIFMKDSPPAHEHIRTPAGFEGEEERQITKMLDSVIRPSESEWATLPLLVRIKDRNMRKELKPFLGYMFYHRSHIKDYASMAISLHGQTRAKVVFIWKDETQTFPHSPCLAFQQTSSPFLLDRIVSNQSTCSGAKLSHLKYKETNAIWKGSYLMVINRKHPVYKVRTRRRENIVNHSNVKACEDITVSLGLGPDSRVWVEIAKSGECKRSVAGIADPSSLSPLPYDGHPLLYPVSEQIPESQLSDDLGASDKSKREEKQKGSAIEHTGTSEAAQAVQLEFLEETYSLSELLNQRVTDIVFRETKFRRTVFWNDCIQSAVKQVPQNRMSIESYCLNLSILGHLYGTGSGTQNCTSFCYQCDTVSSV